MNAYKLYPIILTFSLIFSAGLLPACTDRFENYNTDKTGIDDNNPGIILGIIQEGIYFNYDFGKGKNWPYQLMFNLNADMYSGYMHDYKPFNGGSSNSDYNLQEGWNETFWIYTNSYIMPQIIRAEKLTKINYPDLYAITLILKVEIMHRLTDCYGPIIYRSFGNKDRYYIPDTQEEAYKTFFNDLETAVNILSNYINEEDNESRFSPYDILLDGKYSSWIKFANSLRMRLAIRIAMVEPQTAEKEFKAALEHPGGILDNSEKPVAVSTNSGYLNPLGEINRTWDEVYMNASMESILNGYEDPRRNLFFEPCTKDITLKDRYGNDSVTITLKGRFKGIRQGTCFGHQYYITHSKITVNPTTDAILFTAAETWFLRAEAALRGWTSENPGTCYETGIKASFSQWKAPNVESYLQNDRIGADYIDAFTEDFNINARCKVSPRWDETASSEIKLEKIITQKWLAMFPESCEAWAEQRRTGYPRLFPVLINNSKDGCIDTEIMIRRLNFPRSLSQSEPELFKMLQTAFGKPDNAGSRLWWDTGKNF
ncbi:SusD/RagB family nutrient-binding outer membrane lipoprotein [Coprobacter tertius]|uniref:SusD/RagB family nutrient-binding outer membrane lipoprotein n=1 Tax=Coprobacter tertius TaxID=2944915 RepID=A0ABT1MDK7_9BACT|nr:SusD/RagB family nutrient-binding outer membrane lipoprotein [Coprobacter tertius]MCP9610717.1 SusD/RagB family nutrient-binding outer membrane lipoprotein [Coprobacter tertius]